MRSPLRLLFFTRLGLIIGTLTCAITAGIFSLWFIPLAAIGFCLAAGFYINHQINRCFIRFFALTYIPDTSAYDTEEFNLIPELKNQTHFSQVDPERLEALRDRLENQFADRLSEHSGFKFLSHLSKTLDILETSIRWNSLSLRFMQAKCLATLGRSIDPDLIPIFELPKDSPEQVEASNFYWNKMNRLLTTVARHGQKKLLKAAKKQGHWTLLSELSAPGPKKETELPEEAPRDRVKPRIIA